MGLPLSLGKFRQDCARSRQMMMERQVQAEDVGLDMGMDMGMEAESGTDLPLKPLSLAAMELLLAALDPRLEGFGEGPSCLDDARAFLARVASSSTQQAGNGLPTDSETMEEWIEIWRSAGGNRQTLRLLVQALIAERLTTSTDQQGSNRSLSEA